MTEYVKKHIKELEGKGIKCVVIGKNLHLNYFGKKEVVKLADIVEGAE